MPCTGVAIRDEVEREGRRRVVAEKLKELESLMARGAVRVVIGPQGAVAFVGWSASARSDITDVCAYRTLRMAGSPALEAAVRAAEAAGGRRVNVQAVGAGVHSHDGGQTWSPGH